MSEDSEAVAAFPPVPLLPSWLQPARFVEAWRAIDREAAEERATHPGVDRRPIVTLLVAAVCLLAINYLRLQSSFHAALDDLSRWFGWGHGGLYGELMRGGYGPLASYIWWGIWHVVFYVLVPVAVIKLVFRDRVVNYGLRLGDLRQHYFGYILLATPILFFVVLASFRQDFLNEYPFYRLAYRSWADLLAWEAIYLLQFACLEFFFRGFLLFPLKRAFGANAVLVMCLPYLMIHFPKPWLEATGAILFGLFLGVLALRNRSIWGGVAVHVSVAASMDIAALIQGPGLPHHWLP